MSEEERIIQNEKLDILEKFVKRTGDLLFADAEDLEGLIEELKYNYEELEKEIKLWNLDLF